jgi:hypothetical protein
MKIRPVSEFIMGCFLLLFAFVLDAELMAWLGIYLLGCSYINWFKSLR